tara:strand:+ start:1368 stop:1775 length:408 start_codon:yes stop_codon:yes gene_type:complete
MNKVEIQKIVNRVYPKIKKYYGLSKFDTRTKPPEVKLHHNIYARISGIDEMEGEYSPSAEYERFTNTIWIYWPEAIDEQCVIGSILHEYRHYLQDDGEFKRLYKTYGYDNHPFEIEATKEEENWKTYAKMFGEAK